MPRRDRRPKAPLFLTRDGLLWRVVNTSIRIACDAKGSWTAYLPSSCSPDGRWTIAVNVPTRRIAAQAAADYINKELR